MARSMAGPAPRTVSPQAAPRGVVAAVMAVFALVAATWMAPAAGAHNWLTSSNPAADSTITSAPASVQLTFNDRVLTQPAPPQVVVTGPDGKHYETACAQTTDRQVDVAWKPGSPGTYRVEYRIVSADGHPVSSSMSFTYRGASGGNAGRDKALSCGSDSEAQAGSSGGSSGSASAAGSSKAESGGSSAPVIVAVATAVLAAGAIIAMILRSRRGAVGSGSARRHDDDDDSDDHTVDTDEERDDRV